MSTKTAFEDYLEAILILEERREPIQSVRVAKILGVSRPAVNQAMKAMIIDGYIVKPDYGEISLTDKGREVARMTFTRHTIIKNFLIKIGVNEKAAEEDACKIEHIVSAETLAAFEKF